MCHPCSSFSFSVLCIQQTCTSRFVAGDPPPEKEVGAETSDDEDAPVTCNDESFAAVAAVRVGY